VILYCIVTIISGFDFLLLNVYCFIIFVLFIALVVVFLWFIYSFFC